MFKDWIKGSPLVRWASYWRVRFLVPVVKLFHQYHVSPNTLTYIGALLHIPVAFLIFLEKLYLAALIFAIAGILDVLDGELARYEGNNTNLGAFLDSFFDKLGDIIVHIGFLFYLFKLGIFPVLLVLISLCTSMLSSHIRSRAGMIGIEWKKIGFAQRGEHMTLIFIFLLLNELIIMLCLLVLLNIFTISQRFYYVWRNLNS